MRDRGSSRVRGVSNEQQSSLQGIHMAMRDGFFCPFMFYVSSINIVNNISMVLILVYIWLGAPIMDSLVVDIREYNQTAYKSHAQDASK